MNSKLLIVDIESTCWEGNVPGLNRSQKLQDMEIIEFGCVVAELSGKVIDAKSFFVRPVLHPKLSEFCSSLTSISQSQVDNSPTFVETVVQLDSWLENYDIEFWGSWGNYDRNHISLESERHGIAPKFFHLEHRNLKKSWRKGKPNSRKTALFSALKYHGLAFEGRSHRGIDDALNVARLVAKTNWD